MKNDSFLLSELVRANQGSKEEFVMMDLDFETGHCKVYDRMNWKIGEGFGMLWGDISKKAYLYYLYRFKDTLFDMQKISIDFPEKEIEYQFGKKTKIREESIVYSNKIVNPLTAQKVMRITNGRRLSRMDFEHFYKLVQKTILMPSFHKPEFKSIGLTYEVQ